jgi:hypothetical protein
MGEILIEPYIKYVVSVSLYFSGNLANCMELSLSSEAASYAATQEFPGIPWNPKVYCRVPKSLPLVPILRQINPAHNTSSCP